MRRSRSDAGAADRRTRGQRGASSTNRRRSKISRRRSTCRSSASLAPGARIVVYEAPNDERGFLDAVRAAIFDEEYAPSVLSISYGWPEHLWTPVALDILDDLFTAAALVGVSVFCASGDNGAELDYDGNAARAGTGVQPVCDRVRSDRDRCRRARENRRGRKPAAGSASDSTCRHGKTPRDASCIAERRAGRARRARRRRAASSPGYYVVMDGVELAMGGTSAVAPMWSALTARINQRLGVPIGFFSPSSIRSRTAARSSTSPRAATTVSQPAPDGIRARVSAFRSVPRSRKRCEPAVSA